MVPSIAIKEGVYKSLQELEKEGEKAKRGAIKGAVKLKLKADKNNSGNRSKIFGQLLSGSFLLKILSALSGISEAIRSLNCDDLSSPPEGLFVLSKKLEAMSNLSDFEIS